MRGKGEEKPLLGGRLACHCGWDVEVMSKLLDAMKEEISDEERQ